MNVSTKVRMPACQITGIARAGQQMHSPDSDRVERFGSLQPFSKAGSTISVAARVEGGCSVS
jgi:hypothetical protein